MYCIVCGSKNPEYAIFCFNCGSKLVRPPVEVAPKSAPITPPEQAAVLPGSYTPDSQKQVFSISARDLADFNPFLFSDEDEIAATLPAPLPIQPVAVEVEEAKPASASNQAESQPPVETKVGPLNEFYTQAVSSIPDTFVPPAVSSYAPPSSTAPAFPPVPPVVPSLSHPTANPYGFNPNSVQPVPAPNRYPNVPPTAPAPPTYANPVGQSAPPPYNVPPSNPNLGGNPYGGQPTPQSNPYNLYGGPQSGFVPAPPPRPLIAPNGLPYVVVDHPKSFYEYKTKTGQRVYAAYSEVWQRLLAAALDTLVILAPFFLIMFIYLLTIGPDLQKLQAAINAGDINASEQYLPHWISLLLYLVYLAYTTFLTADGQTLGKRIFRLKVITLAGPRPDLRTSFMRNLFGFAFVLGAYIVYYQNPLTGVLGQGLETIVGIGFALILFDPRRQGWHDKLAGTLVVKSKELVEGVDFPAKGQL